MMLYHLNPITRLGDPTGDPMQDADRYEENADFGVDAVEATAHLVHGTDTDPRGLSIGVGDSVRFFEFVIPEHVLRYALTNIDKVNP